MKQLIQKTAIIIAISAIVLGCKKEDEVKPDNQNLTSDTNASSQNENNETANDDISETKCLMTRNYSYQNTDYGEYSSELLYTYNSSGSQTGYTYNANGNLSAQNKNYQYNSNNQVTYYEEFNSDNLKTRTVSFTYDLAGNIIKETYITDNYSTTYERTFDNQNREIGYKYFANNNLSSEHKNYQYDERNNLISYDGYNGNGLKTNTNSFEYDDNNNRIKDSYIYDNSSTVYERTFDNQNRETSYKYFANGTLSLEHKNYQYDAEGNTTYYERFNESGNKMGYNEFSFQCFE